ncbi:MAG: 30S ribosomal protein S9 [Candidatus Nealsonbacteria bacterium CG23_combo_of_CG06-09_8_20_14_all_39_25]|uniref:Small ribosomal subunit protein uS9 n=4 Tax=Candidatus Nealsoniibacteriota TaxID=1817911 RepID=A0A2G9YSU3_9BACT|nr:MAG: 30S ribosomal protein S9 [Candidatus Nealsonbacteria bacterium CG23_combo_of_CG06-09_8_20_14_all_39_25]PIQ98299.1 MAG: 30S ribosomal protein S9 [Candidatus Nealsonbacteria bacterium CG11_big_fil_rev_8_21_14_0_20_39_9]PIW89904.1 MAG: 30S ribosomal protein S9 [Candidatus Nealsonbacteria bacterium CG_4_8_14_3_um_filter_40_11]PIZ88445.1 MAG: 30S ribosomal protein S9 [Candidatus Nealsonbacteria bacterium CG_4_10_14_0_2_um_filter_39_15]
MAEKKKTKTRPKKGEPKVKKVAKKRIKKKPAPSALKEEEKYLEAVGRRKTAIARIRLFTKGGKTFIVNGKPIEGYFPTFALQQIAKSALDAMKCLDKFRISAKVTGGGLNSQAEAVRHGITRALVLFNPDFRKRLKKAGFLKRDPRMRERKKFGLKRARRAPQWAKR